MNLKKEISVACLKIFRTNVNPKDSSWAQIELFKDAFGAKPVLDAFLTWAETFKDFGCIPYPLTAFLSKGLEFLPKDLPATPASEESLADSAEVAAAILREKAVKDLCGELYLVGGPGFTGRYKDYIADLLTRETAKDIREAYTEFISKSDEYQLKSAVKRFVEGGADAALSAIKKKKQAAKDLADLVERATKQAAANAPVGRKKEPEEEFIPLPEA